MELTKPVPDLPAGFRDDVLASAQADAGLRLSRLAGWNQEAADWRFLLEAGRGTGIWSPDGRLAATLVELDHAPSWTWIGMVLTDPDFRRRGLASWLMRRGLERIASAGRVAVLDATPAGENVYRPLGFAGTERISRYFHPAAEGRAVREAGSGADWAEAVERRDRAAFGADRGRLLRHLAGREPSLFRVWRNEDDAVAGYLLGRNGTRAFQLGPLVGPDASVAEALLQDGLSRLGGAPVYLDVYDRHTVLARHLEATGWTRERGFLRMSRGGAEPTADAAMLFATAGPELG